MASMTIISTVFTEQVGIEVPIICGAMYPCSNPELMAAVSEAGGMAVIQPIAMEFVHGYKLRDGIRYMRTLTDKPLGLNAIVEKSSKIYLNRMKAWVDIALEEGIRFFVTALGKPDWVVEKVHAVGGYVYHDVTERKWAERALEHGVDGLICVNQRAGGHAGEQSPRALYEDLQNLGVPLVCAGGIGDETGFVNALDLGYSAVQMGTRFIATDECLSHSDYKNAIVQARPEDIVLTEKISGVPVAIIKTPYIEKTGTKAGWLAKRMLRHPKYKHWMRTFYSVRSIWQLRKASRQGMSYKDFFQAGRSVEGIVRVESAGDIVTRYARAARARKDRTQAGAA
jgi:nitronate monooxygenase